METGLSFRIINYPFMGTDINTERLMLMAKLCYTPIGSASMAGMVYGEDNGISDEEAGRFVRGLISSGHMGALEHWYTSFAVEGYSRVSSQQNDRHRIMKMFKDHGCAVGYFSDPEQGSADTSQLQQSQRYVKEQDFNFVVPPSIKANPEAYERFLKLQKAGSGLPGLRPQRGGLTCRGCEVRPDKRHRDQVRDHNERKAAQAHVQLEMLRKGTVGDQGAFQGPAGRIQEDRTQYFLAYGGLMRGAGLLPRRQLVLRQSAHLEETQGDGGHQINRGLT